MMESHKLYDLLMQIVGLVVLAGLTSALIFAFREELLPYQKDGDVFETVYARSEEEESETVSGEVSETEGENS